MFVYGEALKNSVTFLADTLWGQRAWGIRLYQSCEAKRICFVIKIRVRAGRSAKST